MLSTEPISRLRTENIPARQAHGFYWTNEILHSSPKPAHINSSQLNTTHLTSSQLLCNQLSSAQFNLNSTRLKRNSSQFNSTDLNSSQYNSTQFLHNSTELNSPNNRNLYNDLHCPKVSTELNWVELRLLGVNWAEKSWVEMGWDELGWVKCTVLNLPGSHCVCFWKNN